jgi:hypothetical protein
MNIQRRGTRRDMLLHPVSPSKVSECLRACMWYKSCSNCVFCFSVCVSQGFPDYYALVGLEVGEKAGWQGVLTNTLDERYKQVSGSFERSL